MLMRSDPFREIDRLTQQLWGSAASPSAMPLDAYKEGHSFVAEFDLPGANEDSIEITVERNVLTVRAERTASRARDADVEVISNERPHGAFARNLFLGDALDSDHIDADYTNGVLTLRIPIAESAKPKKIEVKTAGAKKKAAISA